MASSPSTTPSDLWEYQVGRKPNTVTAFERVDRGSVATVRWWDGSRRRYLTRSLGIRLRDDAGKLVEEQVAEAEEKAERLQAHLLLHGEPPPRSGGRSTVSPTSPATAPAAPTTATPLSIEAGLNRALRVPEGMYPEETEHVRECRRARRDILNAIDRVSADAQEEGRAPTVDATTSWESLRYRAMRDLWQAMARRLKETGQGGLVWTERCIGLLVQVSVWLHLEDEATSRAVTMPKRWRKKLARDWEAITQTAPTPEARPRHELDEAREIASALDHPDVDPRMRLAGKVGFDARLGQARRVLRSKLSLKPVGVFGLGTVEIPGRGNKKGVKRDLTPADRSAFDEALATYLAAC